MVWEDHKPAFLV